MNREAALVIAERSADVAWRAMKAPKAFGWFETLDPPGGLVGLAHWIEAHADQPAAALYAHATREDARALPWMAIRRELRVALELFRATYLMMLREVQADEVAARRKASGMQGRPTNVVAFPRNGGDAA